MAVGSRVWGWTLAILMTATLMMIHPVDSKLTTTSSRDVARRHGASESLMASSTSYRYEACPSVEPAFFRHYRDEVEISEFLSELKSSARFKVTSWVIGSTHEGRSIRATRFASLTRAASTRAKTLLVVAGVHAREWTGIMSVLYAMSELARDAELASDLDVVFVPVANPDGLAKTFEEGSRTKEKVVKGATETERVPHRYWRKNGADPPVDLNRNFPTRWGSDNKTKSIRLPASDVYQGSSAASEPETRALLRLASELQDELVGFLDVHCCIGAVLGPPVDSATPESIRAHRDVAEAFVEALSAAGRDVTRFLKGDGEPGRYVYRPRDPRDHGAGLSSTWGFLGLGLDVSLILELRGKFVAPCYEIEQLGREVLEGIKLLLERLAALPRTSLAQRLEKRRIGSSATTSATRATSATLMSWTERESLRWGVGGLTVLVVGGWLVWWLVGPKRARRLLQLVRSKTSTKKPTKESPNVV